MELASCGPWAPKYDDIREELEEVLERLQNEEARREAAQPVIQSVWQEKLRQFFGEKAPDANPLYPPCKDEGTCLKLFQFFEINLRAL